LDLQEGADEESLYFRMGKGWIRPKELYALLNTDVEDKSREVSLFNNRTDGILIGRGAVPANVCGIGFCGCGGMCLLCGKANHEVGNGDASNEVPALLVVKLN
jgi:hypothetical protein